MSRIGSRRKRKKLNKHGAYSSLRDNSRIEQQISGHINSEVFPKDTGLFLTEDNESLPIFWPVGATERVFSRKIDKSNGMGSGSRIVLTKDNYGHRATGLGGAGGTMCEAIDIVAGSLSCEKKDYNAETKSRGNFITDGARIYLTERGDIQHYFGVGEASKAVSVTSKMKSGIGIKADHTLIIGRERVRIVAGLAAADGGSRLVNLNENVTPRIEIAAIYDSEAQPAVLGNNLVNYLKKQNEEIQRLRNKLYELEMNLLRYKTAMALHTHIGFGLGVVSTVPSAGAATQAAKSIPAFLETTQDNIIQTYNAKIREWKSFGLGDGIIKGAPDLKILSDTVYIGR